MVSYRSTKVCLVPHSSHLGWFLCVAEPPKILGPGALIFVAKQLWPKSAHTSSSSSEASIKAALSRITQTTLTRRWAQRLQHRIFHTSQSSKVIQKSELHKLFKYHSLSGSNKTSNERKWRIDKARTKASLSGRVVSTSWRAIPLNRPAQRQGTRPSKTREQIFEVSTWKQCHKQGLVY